MNEHTYIHSRTSYCAITLFLFLFAALSLQAANKVSITNLRTEQMVNPMGLDTETPRMSWFIESDQNHVIQQGYQIIAATSPTLLTEEKADLWNTGKVISRESVRVKYAGRSLSSNLRVYWRVRVFTNVGESEWSKVAMCSIGLTGETRWSGRWVGLDKLMSGDSASVLHSRLSARYLRKEFSVEKKIKQATAYIAGLGLYELYINGEKTGNQVLAPSPTDYRKTIIYNTFDITSQIHQQGNAVGVILGNGRFFAPRQNKPYKNTTFGFPKCRMNIIIDFTDGTHQVISSDVSDGLFNNQARMVIEMPDHRILVQTEGMFNLYDGHSFKELECDKTKAMDLQSFLNVKYYFDHHHRLWIKDFHHLYIIDTRTYQFLRPRNFFRASGIHSEFENFFLDADGNAWITTLDYKVYFYDFHHRAQLVFHLPQPVNRGNHVVVTDMVEVNSRYYIFTSDGWMRCLNRQRTKELYRQRLDIQKFGFRMLVRPQNNRTLIIRRCEGLFKYDLASRTMTMVIRDKGISDFFCCKNGEVWVSYTSGVYRLDKNLKTIANIDDIRESNLGKTVHDSWLGLTVDYQNGLWLCSFNNGVMYYNSKSTMTSLYKNGVADAGTNSFNGIIDYDNSRIFALTSDGLYLFNRFTHAFTNVGGRLSHVYGKSISKDSKGNLWIGTHQNGLYCYNPMSGAVQNYGTPTMKDSADFTFCEETGNGVYLVCSDKNRLALLSPSPYKYHLISDKFQKLYDFRYMVCACRIPGGFIIGTLNGLFFYSVRDDRVDFRRFAALNDNIYSNKCNFIITDRQGRIWVGTQNGLLCYDERRHHLKRYSSADGLPNSCVQSMAEDRHGNMWITTTNGMAKMTFDRGRLRILTLDKQDGIDKSNFQERSVCSLRDVLYFGTTNGIYEVNTERVNFPKIQLTPCVTDLFIHSSESTLNGFENMKEVTDRLSADNHLELKYNENFITIDISALNYLFPTHTIYRYQLVGIDRHPINVSGKEGKISVSYTSLPSGNYQFVVQAAMFGQPWGKPVTINIHVAPPYWFSWWAIMIYVTAIIAITLYVINLYIKFKRYELDLEQRAKARLEREKLDEMKFRFFTNITHEFRPPLTLIITPLQAPLSHADLPKDIKHTRSVIQRSAHSLNTLVTQLLDFRSLEQNGEVLQPAEVQLGALLNSIKNTFGEMAKERKILFSVTGNAFDTTFWLDLPKMQKIINNLLSNAFKFTNDGGSISLTAEVEG